MLIYKKRRSEVEILDAILSGALEKVKKTYLLNQSRISYYQFSEYFSYLLENGFISETVEDSGENFYIITDDGKQLLENIKSILTYTNCEY